MGKDQDADLSGANLNVYEGLTQEEMDLAAEDSDNLPYLKGVVDANTGRHCVWRRKSTLEQG